MVRRLVRAAASGGKGVLGLLAGASLVLWGYGDRKPSAGSTLARWVVHDDRQVESTWQLGFYRGRVGVLYARFTYGWPRQESQQRGTTWSFRHDSWSWMPVSVPSARYYGPVGVHTQISGGPSAWHSVTVPLWLVALLTGAWPLASIALALRRHRRALREPGAGLCRHCGYDLRAAPSPDGTRPATCPACETPAAPA